LKKFVGRLIGTAATTRVGAHGPRIGQVARRSLAHPARHRQARRFVRGEGHGHRGQLRALQSLCDGFLASSCPALHRPEFFWQVQGAGPGLRIAIQSEGAGRGQGHRSWQGPAHQQAPPLVVAEGSSAHAVKARAQTIQREHEKKAAAADTKFNGTPAGAQGPIAAKLATFGKAQAQAFGWFGECSPALEHLLSRAADFGSQHLWQPMMAASQGKATHAHRLLRNAAPRWEAP
jgi:hypothetical protein